MNSEKLDLQIPWCFLSNSALQIDLNFRENAIANALERLCERERSCLLLVSWLGFFSHFRAPIQT